MRPTLCVPCLVLAAAVSVCGGPAVAASRAVHGDSLPPVRAFRLTAPVVVDGALTEPAWQGHASVTRLTQSDPIEGAAASESTWIWVAYDDDALYIAARLWDRRPDSLVVRLARRDEVVPSDRLTIYLDPFHDHRTGSYFSINAAGVLSDGLLYNEEVQDDSWDGVWSARVRRDAGPLRTAGAAGAAAPGWTCEVRIPFSQVRYRPGAEQVWGVNFRRRIERRREDDRLVYTPKKESGFASRFPHLVGLENGHRSRSIELLPYTTGKAEYLARRAGDPFNDGSRYTPGTGADLRMGVGNNLTLNATANPDFGQVEVDPAVVNLSDVESFFGEKRPFFTENQNVFDNFGREGANNYFNYFWGGPTFFYTRRIGRSPQGGVPGDAEFRDVPMATHILGAAKLTGKLSPSLSFGMLNAVTSREDARYVADGREARAEVEPLTWYGVTRGLKESRGGRNGLGAMTTLAQRRLGGSGLADVLNEQSLMAGLDGWHFLDRKKVWVLSGWAGMTRVTGTESRMIAVQRSSRHYFQRPDADHLGVDSSATSLTGFGARVYLNKQEGDFFTNSAVGFRDPKFEVNDVGYLAYSDVVNAHTVVGYRWTAPNRWRKEANTWAGLYEVRDFGGNVTHRGTSLAGWARFLNDWTLNASVDLQARTMNNRRTRGGPLTVEEPAWGLDVHLDTNDGKKLFHCGGLSLRGSPATGSSSWSVGPRLVWKPQSALSLEVRPALDRVVEDAQYVTRIAAPGEVAADLGGARHVFARLEQTTVSAGVRFNVCLTPNLSLQTYVQPLISAGRYSDLKELARAGSYEFTRYGPGYDPETGTVTPVAGTPFKVRDPDFNTKALRGNAVLRWEYRPGSVLYFVWTQDRSDSQDVGELDFGPSVRRLFDAQANDIFLVKATYHLSL